MPNLKNTDKNMHLLYNIKNICILSHLNPDPNKCWSCKYILLHLNASSHSDTLCVISNDPVQLSRHLFARVHKYYVQRGKMQ